MWDWLGTNWEKMFTALVEFKHVYGHCNVSQKWPESPRLGRWVTHQRSQWSKGQLDDEHIQRLERIGFEWIPHDVLWEKRFLELVEFNKTHGHCNVPQRYPPNSTLGTWVSDQRARKNTLSKDHIRRLEEIGFIWNKLEANWEEMFSILAEFVKLRGHCYVPRNWPENPRLGRWVSKQRDNRKKGLLSEERFKRLDEVGFIWKIRNQRL